MTFELSILNLLILFGAFQGFLLTIILLTTKRFKKRSNQFLAMLLFSLALLNLVSTIELLPRNQNNLIQYNPFFFVNLIPPSLYFMILYLTNPSYHWNRKDYIFFLPAVMEFGIRLFKFSFYLRGDLLSASEMRKMNVWVNSFELIAVLFTVSVLFWSIRALKKYEIQLYENYAEVSSHSLSWLRKVLIAGIGLTVLWLLVTLSDFSINHFSMNLAMATLLCLTILIYWVGYSMIIRQELLDTPIFAVPDEKTVNNDISELSSKADEYFERLKRIMKEDKLYQDSNLNMTVLSKKTGLSNSYLSQIINQKEGKNFFDFVNEYRLEEVKAKLRDPNFAHYTLLAIAQDAGFKSKSTFNAFFKKVTGTTPSEYRKQI